MKICLFSNRLSYISSQSAEDFIESIYDENDLLELALDIIGIVPDDSDEYSRDDYYNVWADKLEDRHKMEDCEMDNFIKENQSKFNNIDLKFSSNKTIYNQ